MAPAGRPRSFDKDTALTRAMHVFWDKGYEGTTMTDLIDAIGVKGPSVYAAFGNKDSIFMEVVKVYTNMIQQGPIKALNDEEDIYLAIQKLLNTSLKLFTNPNNPTGCLIMTSAINATPEHSNLINLLRAHRNDYKAILVKRFELAIHHGQVKKDANPEELAEYYMLVIHGAALRAKDGSSIKQLEAAINIALFSLNDQLTHLAH